jgi:hypothetical protein
VCIPRSALPALPDSACELRSSGGLMFPSYLSSHSIELACHRRTKVVGSMADALPQGMIPPSDRRAISTVGLSSLSFIYCHIVSLYLPVYKTLR